MQNNKRYKTIDLKLSEFNESFFLSSRGLRFILYEVWFFLDKRSQASLLNTCKELNRHFYANVSKLNYFLRSLNVTQVSVPAVLPYTESEIGGRQDLIDFNSIEKKATDLLDDLSTIDRIRNDNYVIDRIRHKFIPREYMLWYFIFSCFVFCVSFIVFEIQQENTQNYTSNNRVSNSTNIDANNGIFGGAFTTTAAINFIIASLLAFIGEVDLLYESRNCKEIFHSLILSFTTAGGVLVVFGAYIIYYDDVFYDALFLSFVALAFMTGSCLRYISNCKKREINARYNDLQLGVNDLQLGVNDLQESLLTSDHGNIDIKESDVFSSRI